MGREGVRSSARFLAVVLIGYVSGHSLITWGTGADRRAAVSVNVRLARDGLVVELGGVPQGTKFALRSPSLNESISARDTALQRRGSGWTWRGQEDEVLRYLVPNKKPLFRAAGIHRASEGVVFPLQHLLPPSILRSVSIVTTDVVVAPADTAASLGHCIRCSYSQAASRGSTKTRRLRWFARIQEGPTSRPSWRACTLDSPAWAPREMARARGTGRLYSS